MKSLSQLSNKFAMKLGLESRPLSSFDDSSTDELFQYDEELSPSPPISDESLIYIGEESAINNQINMMRVSLRELSTQADLGNFDATLKVLKDMTENINIMHSIIIVKQSDVELSSAAEE